LLSSMYRILVTRNHSDTTYGTPFFSLVVSTLIHHTWRCRALGYHKRCVKCSLECPLRHFSTSNYTYIYRYMSQNYISTQEMDGLMVRISKSDLKVLDMITIKPPFFLGFHRFHHLFFWKSTGCWCRSISLKLSGLPSLTQFQQG
jgi:hypothetical protein